MDRKKGLVGCRAKIISRRKERLGVGSQNGEHTTRNKRRKDTAAKECRNGVGNVKEWRRNVGEEEEEEEG